jgi:hypothetical protein
LSVLSDDHGWLITSFLRVGEPVQRADGSTATVVAEGAPSSTSL